MPGCKPCSRRGIASRLSECKLCSTWKLLSLDAEQAVPKALGVLAHGMVARHTGSRRLTATGSTQNDVCEEEAGPLMPAK